VRSITVATWNLEWAIPGSGTESRIRGILEGLEADIMVLTEASTHTVPSGGHVVSAEGSWGYSPKHRTHRKVFLWSKTPWEHGDHIGPDGLPPGRFVAATTTTLLGATRVIGMCIPWKDAHVRTGSRDRAPWEDHRAYIRGVREILSSATAPVVVAGDFNQKIPRKNAPREVAEELLEALGSLRVATVSSGADALIDHIAHSTDLNGRLIATLPRSDERGRLTDHLGAVVELSRR